MSETIDQLMINAVTGERTTIQLKPRPGLTAAEATAFLAARKEAGKEIDPDNCTIIKIHTEVLDSYGIFEVPDEWSCIGSERFVRNLPDGDWVSFHDLPEHIYKALEERGKRRGFDDCWPF